MSAHPDVDWRSISRLRIVLAHHYHRTDPDLIWSYATEPGTPSGGHFEEVDGIEGWASHPTAGRTSARMRPHGDPAGSFSAWRKTTLRANPSLSSASPGAQLPRHPRDRRIETSARSGRDRGGQELGDHGNSDVLDPDEP